jgi:DNA replication and repair protein RecF
MPLRQLQVTDFRCLHQAEIGLDPQFTLITGPNASGKTSLLEAVYLLGRGRSFRTRRLQYLIHSGAQRFFVFGDVEVSGRRATMGIEGSAAGMHARLGGERVASLAELATVLPVQIIDPEIHHLIDEGPSRRRRFLDWGVFHVEPGFVLHWQKYHQALRQRNAALRAGQPSGAVEAWDSELIRYGELVTASRRRYVGQLAPEAGRVAQNLLGMELELGYRTGWARELELREAMNRSRRQDQEAGATQVGPQRAELIIRLNGVAAKDRVSRGQQKLLAAVLLIAQIKLFPAESAARPTLLLDDPAAELDADRLGALIQEVGTESLQLVVTSLHGEPAELTALGRPGRRYRLDRGSVHFD